MPQHSPAQKEAKKVAAKYKRGFYKSPGKLQRIRDALTDIDNGSSVCKAAKKHSSSESMLRRRLSGEVTVDSRNGPLPVFSSIEEIEMAKWLSEMAQRGMGLGPSDFLDFVQGIIKKEKRKSVFPNDRPGYTWYYNFMARNSHIVEKRKESSLENSRAKVTSKQLDEWFDKYKKFVSQLHLLDQPQRIYNADESGFSMGSKPSSVIGPTKKNCPSNPPHLCGQTKKRLTGMFCANAEGDVIPPFLVYPQPKPTAYDPLIGSRKGTVIEYTEKGWMNSKTFLEFLKHFNKYACSERPVILLVDSVSSHMSIEVFTFAKSHGIELYRLQPNATHFLQPLDNGVFGPLKKIWYQTVRKFTKENPGQSIGKETFAAKLNNAFMQFYKPLTVANSFKTTGIFPVDRARISENIVKPSITFQDNSSVTAGNSTSTNVVQSCTTEVEQCCTTFIAESSSEVQNQQDVTESYVSSGLSLLAEIALSDINNNEVNCCSKSCTSKPIEADETLSPVILEALVYPSSSMNTNSRKRKSVTETKLDCLTSAECIRNAALKQLESVRRFARKEQTAKSKYLKSSQQKSISECANSKKLKSSGKSKPSLTKPSTSIVCKVKLLLMLLLSPKLLQLGHVVIEVNAKPKCQCVLKKHCFQTPYLIRMHVLCAKKKPHQMI